jgi:CRISPR-associated protein Cmr3
MFKINALDSLFFRDGKPFTMGEETAAEVVFPPYPSVLHGMLRTAAFFDQHDEFTGGSAIDVFTQSLNIQQMFLQCQDQMQVYLPAPRDFFIQKGSSLFGQLGQVHSNVGTSQSLSHYLQPEDDGESVSDAWITLEEFKKYTNGEINSTDFKRSKDLYSIEPKIGNGRNDALNAVEEGMLYAFNMIRPKVNFLLDADWDAMDNSQLVRLGGEGKMVNIQKTSEEQVQINAPTLDTNVHWLKLYLATPAIFPTNGWKPEIGIEPSAACVGRYQSIGGFDQQKNQPKTMYRAVPAGSVFYFQGKAEELKQILAFHGKSLCSPEFARQGFGIAYCALLSPDQLI